MTATTAERLQDQTRLLVPIYICTMLLSACLLFLVQPMFARMALPLLGGTPAVWAIAMCFFQLVLLGGYAYAHLLKKFLGPQQAVLLHLFLMAGSWFFLPVHVSLGTDTQNVSGSGAGLWLVGLMAKSIGYPFFFLSATAPLLQSWFARTTHRAADNPYFLYSASNVGSIGALIIYPFIVEPNMGLAMQAKVWSFGYAALMLGIGLSGFAMLRNFRPLTAGWGLAGQVPVTLRRKLWWVFMAFVPSALLVAWTNHITTDIASAPFLWLPPLVLFLLTFVLVFRDVPLVSPRLARIAQLVTLPICYFVQFALPLSLAIPVIIIGAIFFFATAIICHRQLYESRPEASRLTEFYMLMSVGGVLGGLFVSLLAPVIFNTVAEYPLLMLVGVACWLGLYGDGKLAEVLKKPLIPMAVFVVALLLAAFTAKNAGAQNLFLISTITNALFIALAILFVMAQKYAVAALGVILALITSFVGESPSRLQLRNYFGEISIVDNGKEGPYRVFLHGTTMHGAESLVDLAPDNKAKPHSLTYYSPESGMARSITTTQDRLNAEGRRGSYRIIGLGSGAAACYVQQGEDWAYYEIDPNVTKVAKDSSQFSFLNSCTPNIPVIEGDARLTLMHGAAEKVDYLLVDAFSSDSIPVHLITTEAMQLYLSRLKDDGLLAMHVTNRYMDLVPVVAANLKAIDPTLQARVIDYAPAEPKITGMHSIVVVISRKPEAIAQFEKAGGTTALPISDGIDPWTDDFANLPAAMLRRMKISKY